MKERCLIIAEAGVNHNGDVNIAYRLCDAAKEVGADVVKFQTWKTENIITKNVAQAQYQVDNTNKLESQYDMLKKLELSYEDFSNIKKYCDKIGIIFSSTADDSESLDFLISIGIPFIKIGSGDMGNISFLRYIGSKNLPIIMSTGMSSLNDIDISLKALRDGGATDITLLHCTTSYPCSLTDVNLRAMNTIREVYQLPVGYSDHTSGNVVAIAAVVIGAKIIEKHFTLDKNLSGPDHKASLNPVEFKEFVRVIRNTEKALGDGYKVPTKLEKDISKLIIKRIVAKKYIKKNQIITSDDICTKRNDKGLLCNKWDLVIGAKAKRDFLIDDGIEF